MNLVLRDRSFALRPGRPLVMGIVNANPDSFSDAVRTTTLDAQVALAVRLCEEGADVIDVGGESGVTYTGVTAEEVERDRVVPLVERLVAEGICVSVDTWKVPVAEAALAAGAHVLNDVSGLRDVGLARAAAKHDASLVVMHTRAEPKVEHFADYGGRVVEDVVSFVHERCEIAMAEGVSAARLIVDPGPDFAKSPAESVEVLREIDALRALGHPWLAAVSRKYFLAAITGRPPAERLAGTLAAVGFAADRGAAMVRVHDVAATVDFLAVRSVLNGVEEIGAFDADDDALKWIRATPSP
ncbi:dihydropteroate synthase [Conexibacter woesei]|uniref:dihydropteroate synthase n=1 Tax=Conexibacter woesei TaxID=191495 RepID=UPI00041F8819|nr:dihydropteroate synthase [Conexibacter woesei]